MARAASPETNPRRRWTRRDTAAVAVLVVVAAYASVRILAAGRGLTFFYDEWSFVQERRHTSLDTVLGSHNGHLSATTALIYQGLFKVVGLADYTPYRVLVLGCHMVCVGTLFAYVRSRSGAGAALLAGTLLACFGAGAQNLLWPFQIGFLLSIAGALGALLVLDGRGRWADGTVAVVLLVALASSGIGVVAVAAVTVRLVAERSWRRLWVSVGPGLLYVAWHAIWGVSQSQRANLARTPAFVRDAGGAAWTWMVGLDGRHTTAAFAGGLLVLIGLAGVARVRRWPVELSGVLAGLTLTFGFWAITGLSRAQLNLPASSRYLYPGAVFSIVLLAELARVTKLHPVALVGLAAVVATAVVGNLGALEREEDLAHLANTQVRAELGAVEMARDTIPADALPDWLWMPMLRAGPYLGAVDELGSPAFRVEEIRAQSPQVRFAADEVLRSGVQPDHEAEPRRLRCRPLEADGEGGLHIRAGHLWIPGSSQVWLRSFSERYAPLPTATASEDRAGVVRLPPVPWTVRVTGPEAVPGAELPTEFELADRAALDTIRTFADLARVADLPSPPEHLADLALPPLGCDDIAATPTPGF